MEAQKSESFQSTYSVLLGEMRTENVGPPVTGITPNKEAKRNPYNMNIYDLCKTASQPGHTEAVIDLIERLHYDINAPMPSNGLSLFLCACLSGTKKLIHYMLLRGADITSVTKDGDAALYLATFAVLNAKQPDISILDLLIRHGCNVNQQNHKGYVPLHRAASKGSFQVIRCLLRHGANLNLPTKNGIYPIDSATNAGHPEVARYLTIKVNNPHVWDVVDPHTPPGIKMGLRTPMRPNILQSPCYRTSHIYRRISSNRKCHQT